MPHAYVLADLSVIPAEFSMIVLLVSDHTVIKARAPTRTLLAGLAQPIYQLLSEHDKQS